MISESQIQQQVIQYLSLISSKHNFVFMAPMNEGVMMVLKMFKVPNKTCIRLVMWLRKMGFLPGASDLQIFHNGKAYFIEMKTPTGKQSEKQKLFMNNVLKAGCEYAVCRSVDDIKECLKIWRIVK